MVGSYDIEASVRPPPVRLGLGSLAPPPVRARHLRVVVALDEVPLEDYLIAVAAAPAGVKVIAGNRFPAVLPYNPAAHERPGVHRQSIFYRRPRAVRASSGWFPTTWSTFQSGWPGIGGVLVPYSQSRRNPVRLRPETCEASAMKSSVDAD